MIALMAQSITLRHQDRLSEALSALDQLLAIAPGFLPGHASRAEVLAAQARFDEALAELTLISIQTGNSAETAALREQIQLSIEACFGPQLDGNPSSLETRLARARLRRQTCDPQGALADYDAILAPDPDQISVLILRSNTLVELGRLNEALPALDRALELEPGNALAWFNRGNIFQYQRRMDEAITSYRKATEIRPAFAEAFVEESHCLLAKGNFAAAWPLYEWRWKTEQLISAPLCSNQALWLGNKDLSGKTLLVWAEQGFGDTIQFARFVPELAHRAGKLWLRAPTPLHPLLRTLDPRIALIDEKQSLPPHDYQCPLMSLPLALGLGEKVGSSPYLKADFNHIATWRARLGESPRPRIGLVWAGRQYGTTNPTRDIPLTEITPLLSEDFEFVSLQKDIPVGDAELHASLKDLSRHREELTDFGQTAALIANLDLVISADTAVAHLAAALGKPCWVLLRYSREWRWPMDRNDTPWYPSMRTFSQTRAGDWASAVRQVRAALAELGAPAKA